MKETSQKVLKQIISNGLIEKRITCQDGFQFVATPDNMKNILIEPQSLYLYYLDCDNENRGMIIFIE